MSDADMTVVLESREVIGKGLRSLRTSGQVPAVIHDHGKQSLHVSGNFIALNKVYAAAGKHHPVNLKVGPQTHLALIKDADFDPVKRQLRHMVFQAIKQNEKVTAEVPVVFAEGDIPAERAGLLVLKQLDTVEVEAFPKDLPDQLVIDPSKLENDGDHLSVSDIICVLQASPHCWQFPISLLFSEKPILIRLSKT